MKEVRNSFERIVSDIKSEFGIHEQQKQQDFKKALTHFVETQINSEKSKLDCLSDLHKCLSN